MNDASGSLDAVARALARGEAPADLEVLKQSRLRTVARRGDVVLKVLHRSPHKARREAHTLARARALGVPVPDLIGSGAGWVATRFVEGRPAVRDDLVQLLPVVAQMHARGMLHRDLHLGNVLVAETGPVLLDTQKARFLAHLPGWLRHWELGYLAHSLGDPLPDALAHVRAWRERRAQRHWRSRTARCTVESSGFTAFAFEGLSGFRRREVPADALERALIEGAASEVLKETPRSGLYRTHGWIVKRHARPREARAAWMGGVGLEVRGIAAARALAWAGAWLVMEDAGPTLSDWVDAEFERAAASTRQALADDMADLLARLHGARVYHPDLKANNICWRPGAAPRLIDYGHVRFGRRVSRRRRVKNLAQLNAALPDRVPAELRERTFVRYAQRLGSAESLSALRDDVVAQSLRRAHRWTGC